MARRVARWFGRIVLVLLALALAVILTAVVAVHSDWGRDRVRDEIEAALAESFPGGASVGRVTGSVLGDFTLHDIVLRDRAGRPAVRIERVELNLALLALLRDEARLEKAIVEGARVDVVQRGDAPANVATMRQPGTDPMAFDVVIERLDVRAADVTITRDDRVDHVDDVTVLAALRMGQDESLRAVAEVKAAWRERATPLGVTADVAIDPAGVIALAKGAVVAGDVRVEATDLRVGEGNDIRGALHVAAPRGALAALVPEAELTPAALEVDAAVVPVDRDGLRAVLRGRFGGATFLGALSGRRAETRASVGGTIMLRDGNARDLRATLPATSVDSATIIALELEPDAGLMGIRGTIGVDGSGTVDALRFDQLTAGVTLAGGEARLAADARAGGDTQLHAGGVVTVTETERGQIVDLRDGRLVAHSADSARAAQGRVAVAGAIDAELAIAGRLVGDDDTTPRITVRGTIDGRRLQREEVRVGELAVALDLDGIPERPGGNARVRVRGARAGAEPLPDVDVTARGRLDGGFDVTVRADDRARDVRGTVSATVALPERRGVVATVELGRFDVVAQSVRARGHGGRITVRDDAIVVRGVTGATAGGTVTADVVVPRERPTALTGVVAADGIELARLRGVAGVPATLGGTVDARVDVARTHARAQLALRDPRLGSASAIVDVAVPSRREDPDAWRALDRQALRELRLDLRAIDLAALSDVLELEPRVAGRVDGALRLGAGAREATLRVRRLVTDALPEPADLEVALDLDDPALTGVDATATLRGIGAARVESSLRSPARPFDPAAWRRLGLDAIAAARLHVPELVVDERLAARAGAPELRGVVSADLRAGAALADLTGTITARTAHAGPLVDPAMVVLHLHGDGRGTRGKLAATVCGATALTASLSTPRDLVTLLTARADPASVPLSGRLAITDLDVRRAARSFGVEDAPTGLVRGTASVAGTVGAPTGEIALTVEHMGSRRPRRGGPPRGGLRRLTIDARYAAGEIRATARGAGDDGGRLELVADARVDALDDAEARLVAERFELRPLARLAPDVLLGLSGKLDADLRVRGADPETATILGSAVIRDGTLPIHDTIGVMREANAGLTFQPGRARLIVDGTIVSGAVHLEADATLDGLLPQRGSLRATADGIELIMASAPRVTGTLTAELEREGDRWKVTAAVPRGSVTSRVSSGRELHPHDMPADLVFASTAPGARPPVPRARRVEEFIGNAPTAPFLDIVLRVKGVAVDVPQLRGDVGGRVDISLGDDGALVEGKLEVLRGDVIVLERRYRLRRAAVTFDGGLDPLLDLQLERELPELTLFANITGRASDPELELASDPPTYTQGQLLAFALSDTASAAGSETSDAASNLFAAVASQAIVGAISPILPVKLDLIAYEPATASSSRALVFGHWITRRLLVLYRNRTEARVDENVNEAEIEYWLGRRVLFEGVAGDRGILGADLLWTRRW